MTGARYTCRSHSELVPHLFDRQHFAGLADFAVPPPDGGQNKPPPEWVHILPAPDKDGRIYSRDFRIIEVDSLEALVKRSNAAIKRQRGGHPADADHETVWFGGPARAWAEEYEARRDGIYARTRWLSSGADLVSSEEYRYTSSVVDGPAEWQFDKDGWPETLTIKAETLLGFGVTNYPALETHSLFNVGSNAKEVAVLKAMAKRLGVPEGATAEQMKAALRRFTELPAPEPSGHVDDNGTAPQNDAPESEESADESGAAEATPEADALRRALGFSGPATTTQLFEAAADRIIKLETEQAESLVETLCADGRITPAQRKAALDVAREPGGVARLRSLYANAPSLKPTSKQPPKAAPLSAPHGCDPFAYELAKQGLQPHEIANALKQRRQETR